MVDYEKEDIKLHQGIYDIFFDSVANQSLLRVRKTIKSGGAYVTTTPSLETFLLGPLYSLFGSKKAKHIMVKPSHNNLVYLKELVEAKQLRAVVDSMYDHKNIAQAHRNSATGRVVGKLAIKFV